jgi:nitrogen fixation protein FixH
MIARGAGTLTGRHVLLLVVGFFATVLAVNGVMVWLALGSFPGMVSDNAYREGLAYNHVLEAREAQRALGWRVAIEFTGTAPTRIEASFADRDGHPISGLRATALLRRPVARGNDRTVEMREVAAGIYRAEMALPLPGNWQLELEARDRGADEAPVWRMERELWLK